MIIVRTHLSIMKTKLKGMLKTFMRRSTVLRLTRNQLVEFQNCLWPRTIQRTMLLPTMPTITVRLNKRDLDAARKAVRFKQLRRLFCLLH